MTSDIATVLAEIDGVLDKVDEDGVQRLVERLLSAPRVFVAGEGRSGLMAKAFAMRLMHLGLVVYATGETITPSVREGDLVVVVSGSGTTAGAVRLAESAGKAGALVFAVTTDPASTLGELAQDVLVLPAATKYRKADEAPTIQPLSSLFDQVSHITFDVACLEVARRRDVDNERARSTHSNTE
ncbi:MAG: 6-phospho-3-hexuloisomerase [Nocardioides sp.]